jgi:hypothetical protein
MLSASYIVFPTCCIPEYVGRLEKYISTGRGFDGVGVAKHLRIKINFYNNIRDEEYISLLK